MTMSREGERRRHFRLYKAFPVLIRGVDAHGEAFEMETVLDDFSAGGLYIRLRPRVEVGVKLFMVVHISLAPRSRVSAPCVAVRGVVRRVEPQSDGTHGVGVSFTSRRFL